MKYSNEPTSQCNFFNTIPTTESFYQISMNVFENSANKNITVYSNNFYEKFNCNFFIAKAAFPVYFEKKLDFLFSQKIKDEIHKKLLNDYPVLKSIEGLIKKRAELNFEKLSFESISQESFYLLEHKNADRSERRRNEVLDEINDITLAINEKVANINFNILYVPSLNSKNIDMVRNFLCKPINIKLSVPPPNPIDLKFYDNLLKNDFKINLHNKNSQTKTVNISPIIGYTFSKSIANSMDDFLDIEINNIDIVYTLLPDLISLKKVTLKYNQYVILKEIADKFNSIYLKKCIKCFETNLIDLNRAIEKVDLLIIIQRELFSISEHNFDEVSVFVNLMIQKPNFKNEILHQITNASRYNPTREKLYRQLVDNIQKNKENRDFRPKIWTYKFFPIEKILIKDDIESFQDYISKETEFDLESQLFYCSCLKKKMNLIQLSCFYGAILCFKYLISCDIKYNESKLMKFAIAGGNIGIIHILHKPGNKIVPKARQIAALFHRNTILEWLVDQEIDRSNYIESAAISNNFFAAKIYCEEIFGCFIEKVVSYSEINSMVYSYKITSALQKSIKYDHQSFFCFILNFPSVDFSDINSSLLITAIKSCNIKTIELILSFGDSIFQNNSISKIQDTLLAAIKTANPEIVDKIYGLKSVKLSIEGRIDRNEEFANDIIFSGNKEIIRKFIHYGNIFHYPYAIENILSQFVYMNDINSIEKIVDKDYFRIRKDWSPFPSANTVEMVHYLIDCQSNIDYCDVDGQTCLSNAIKNKDIDVILALLESGATIRDSDYEAASPEIKKIL